MGEKNLRNHVAGRDQHIVLTVNSHGRMAYLNMEFGWLGLHLAEVSPLGLLWFASAV